MEPFSIQCETCHSRLKVRKRSAIGQTLTCPKCKGRVKVIPPEEWVDAAPAAAPSARSAATASPSRSANEDRPRPSRRAPSGNSPSGKAPLENAPASATADEIAAPGFEDMDNLLANIDEQAADYVTEPAAPQSAIAEPAPDFVVSRDSSEEPATKSSDGSTEPKSGPLLPNDEWLSESTKSRQKLFMFVGIAIGALLIATLMIAYLIFQMSRPATETAAANDDVNDASIATEDSDDVDPNGDSNDETSTSIDDTDPPADTPNGNQAEDDANNHESTVPNDVVTSDTNQTDTDDNSADLNSTSDDSTTDDSPPGFRINQDVVPSNFLNDPILNGLGDLDRLVDDDGSADARDAAIRQRREGSWSVLDADAPFVEAPRPIEINIETQLQTEVLELKQDDLSVLEFLDLMSRLSGVPISINTNAMSLPALQDGASVNLHIVEQTLGDALQQTLRPLNLSYLELGNSLEVVPVSMLSGSRESSYDVGDLLDGFPDREEDLILILRSLISPSSWDEQGGTATVYEKDDTLFVEQTELNHERIKVFLNLLRLVRGLPSFDDTICGPERLHPHAVANDCLAERFNLELYQPTRLTDVIQRLNETANITVVINWESLARQGWNWETELPLVVQDQTVEFALRRLAVSLDVAFRIIGPREFELLSKSGYELRPEFGFYDCAPLLAAGIDIESVASQIRNVFPRTEDEEVYPFYYDTASQHIVARLTQAELATLQKFMSAWERTAISRKR